MQKISFLFIILVAISFSSADCMQAPPAVQPHNNNDALMILGTATVAWGSALLCEKLYNTYIRTPEERTVQQQKTLQQYYKKPDKEEKLSEKALLTLASNSKMIKLVDLIKK